MRYEGGRCFMPWWLPVAAVLSLGCGGDDATAPRPRLEPQPGELRVTLTDGPAAAGAVVVSVTGPGATSPVPAASSDVYHVFAGDTLRAAIVGPSLDGEILRFSVPDMNRVGSYRVSLEQAAGTGNEPLATTGFLLAVTR